MNTQMDLTAFKTLKAVADHASVTRAADALYCVPSAVTARIRQLESEIGQKVLIHQNNQMRLTVAGRTLYAYAERAIKIFEDAQKAVSDDSEPRGTLRIGATDTAATIYLPPVFARYHETFPDVAIEITSTVTSELTAMVKDHSLDCAIINTQLDDPDIVCERVRKERLILASARSNKNPYEQDHVTFLAARAGGAQRKRVETWWSQGGYPPMRVIEMPSIGLRVSFAAAGIGVTVLPVLALDGLANRDTLRLHDIPEPWSWQETVFISRRDGPGFAALRKFREMLHEAFAAAGSN